MKEVLSWNYSSISRSCSVLYRTHFRDHGWKSTGLNLYHPCYIGVIPIVECSFLEETKLHSNSIGSLQDESLYAEGTEGKCVLLFL